MTIIELLRQRHAEDLFVAECKDGPTQMGSHRRLDAWAMKRSWVSPMYFGYEIKISRSDFLRDEKWPSYLPLCSQLYFVSPAGLLMPEEMPGDVGLMWATDKSLRIKKKAAHRNIEPPEKLFRYVLMCRAKIDAEVAAGPSAEENRAYWRQWLEERKVDCSLGHRVGHVLGARIFEELEVARDEVRRLQRALAGLEAARGALHALGVPEDMPAEYVKGAIERRMSAAWILNVERNIERAERELTVAREAIRRERGER